jgi:hypothetical protein
MATLSDPHCAPVVGRVGPKMTRTGCATVRKVRKRIGRPRVCAAWQSRRTETDPLVDHCTGCIEAAVVAIEAARGAGWLPARHTESRNEDLRDFLATGRMGEDDGDEPAAAPRGPALAHTRLTDEQRAVVVRECKRGASATQAARAAGCSLYHAQAAIKVAGLTAPRGSKQRNRRWPVMTDAQAAEIVAMYLNGASYADCARAVPVGEYQAVKAIRAAGVGRSRVEAQALAAKR